MQIFRVSVLAALVVATLGFAACTGVQVQETPRADFPGAMRLPESFLRCEKTTKIGDLTAYNCQRLNCRMENGARSCSARGADQPSGFSGESGLVRGFRNFVPGDPKDDQRQAERTDKCRSGDYYACMDRVVYFDNTDNAARTRQALRELCAHKETRCFIGEQPFGGDTALAKGDFKVQDDMLVQVDSRSLGQRVSVFFHAE